MSGHLEHGKQKQLALQAQQGDRQAKERLLQSNQALVAHWARRYQGRGVELEDLIQEGQTGMIKALDRYSPDHGANFATYASLWIRQAIGRACERQGSLELFGMRLPSEVCNAMSRTEDDLQQGFQVEQARRIKKQGRPISLDAEVLQDMAASPDASCALARMIFGQSCGHLKQRPSDSVALMGTQLADRAFTGKLSQERWWLASRQTGGAWRLEVLFEEQWLSLPQAAGRLSDQETGQMLMLCEELELESAEDCRACARSL